MSKEKDRKVKLTIYRWAGKKGPFKISSECRECDITVPLVRKIANETGSELEVKPWLDNFLEVLWKGGWHAPIITVSNKVFSQGVVPDEEKLKERIKESIRN